MNKVVQIGNGGAAVAGIEPNHWRVITVAPDDGKQADTFYVFRTPPNATFATDESGRRRAFATYDSAQIVADNLNAEQAA